MVDASLITFFTDKFNSNIPKSPVRILHEMYPGKIGFK